MLYVGGHIGLRILLQKHWIIIPNKTNSCAQKYSSTFPPILFELEAPNNFLVLESEKEERKREREEVISLFVWYCIVVFVWYCSGDMYPKWVNHIGFPTIIIPFNNEDNDSLVNKILIKIIYNNKNITYTTFILSRGIGPASYEFHYGTHLM